MRLHKFIANCGYTSRRHAELLVEAGRVEVNGTVVTDLGTKVRPAQDRVLVNGEPIELPPPTTILFHKPAGIITSTHDTHERLTVMDYLPRSLRNLGLLPAGRLDQDTEGLLIITNVGDLNHRITHPRYETEKEYLVTVATRPARAALRRLETGVMIDGQKTSPARVERVLRTPAGDVEVALTIREGRKRQVRRMFSAVGHDVLRLRRIRIGRLLLGDLPAGEWRRLDEEAIARLTSGTSGTSGRPRGHGDDTRRRGETSRTETSRERGTR